MDAFLALLSLIFSHHATAWLPQIMNRIAQKSIHSGFTFVIKQPLNTAFVMKKSAHLRPVSHKAYARFVERISLVVSDKTKRESLLAALDSYLDGDRDTYDSNLTPDCAMVFGMLRFEIDLAIDRSAKARTRHIRSRRQSVKAESACHDNPIQPSVNEVNNVTDVNSPDDDTIEITPRVSRRMRRAVERIARTKTRWRKLG